MPHQRRPNPIPAPLVSLTKRETEVLALLALGMKNKQIAAILNVSRHTVHFHLSNVYLKIGANNRTHAVMLALRNNIVSKN